MSGKKQHYIPQSLLRGFQSPGESSDRIRVHRRGQAPFYVRTDSISAERHFYSDIGLPGERTLDDEITAYESHLAVRLKTYREEQDGAAVDPSVAAEVVTHLAVRAAYIRGVLGGGVNQLLEKLQSDLADEEESRFALGIDAIGNSTYLADALREKIRETQDSLLPNVPIPLLESIARAFLRENYGQLHRETIPGIVGMIGAMASRMSDFARDGHAKALSAGLAPEKRVDLLKKLHWRVLHRPAHSLILPDCVAMAFSMQGEMLPLLLVNPGDLKQALLPLSHDRILVGSVDTSSFPEEGALRAASAASSWRYFISSPDAADFRELQDHIHQLPSEKLREIVKGLTLRSATQAEDSISSDANSLNPSSAEADAASTLTYEVAVAGAPDAKLCKYVAPVLEALRGGIQWGAPLETLTSVTFAGNFEEALMLTDMGSWAGQSIPAATPPTDRDAMALVVGRNSLPRAAIVAKLWVAEALIDKTSPHQANAVAIIVHAFAEALHDQHLISANPDLMARQVADPWDCQIFPLAVSCFRVYCATRISAPLWEEKIGALDANVASSIQKCDLECKQATREYQSTGDLSTLLNTALLSVGALLCQCAAALGYADGREEDPGDILTRSLGELASRELDQWLNVFHRDLQSRFVQAGSWGVNSETIVIKDHVNRHFWRYGIFPWASGPGETRVEVYGIVSP